MASKAMLVAGAFAALMAAAPIGEAAAQGYPAGYGAAVDPECARVRQQNMAMGAAIGGLAGGLLGTRIAKEKNDFEGAALGAALGAAAGGAYGRYRTRCAPAGYGAQAPYGQAPYGEAPYGAVGGQPSYGYGYGY